MPIPFVSGDEQDALTVSLRPHHEACLFPSELHAQDEIDKAKAKLGPDESARFKFRAYPTTGCLDMLFRFCCQAKRVI